jgi:hypothetical protein
MALGEYDQKLHNKSKYPRLWMCDHCHPCFQVTEFCNYKISCTTNGEIFQVCPTNYYYILIEVLFLPLQCPKQTQFLHRSFCKLHK